MTLGLQGKCHLYGIIDLTWLCREAGGACGVLLPASDLLVRPRIQQVQLRTRAVSKEEAGRKALVLPSLEDAAPWARLTAKFHYDPERDCGAQSPQGELRGREQSGRDPPASARAEWGEHRMCPVPGAEKS